MLETTGPAPSFGLSDGDDPIFNPSATSSYTGPVRTESDSLGVMDIPAEAYWGIHTARALNNFPITRRALSNYPDFIRGLEVFTQWGVGQESNGVESVVLQMPQTHQH